MYLLPVAMMVKEMAGPEFWNSIGYTATDFDIINIEMIVRNLLPVTIGNILGGGVMIGMSKGLCICVSTSYSDTFLVR